MVKNNPESVPNQNPGPEPMETSEEVLQQIFERARSIWESKGLSFNSRDSAISEAMKESGLIARLHPEIRSNIVEKLVADSESRVLQMAAPVSAKPEPILRPGERRNRDGSTSRSQDAWQRERD